MQKKVDEAIDYFRRKVLSVKDKVEDAAKLVQARKLALQQINSAITQKMGGKN